MLFMCNSMPDGDYQSCNWTIANEVLSLSKGKAQLFSACYHDPQWSTCFTVIAHEGHKEWIELHSLFLAASLLCSKLSFSSLRSWKSKNITLYKSKCLKNCFRETAFQRLKRAQGVFYISCMYYTIQCNYSITCIVHNQSLPTDLEAN